MIARVCVGGGNALNPVSGVGRESMAVCGALIADRRLFQDF